MHACIAPPLLAGEGWGGVALDSLLAQDQKLHPLPASPCKQGEEHTKRALAPLTPKAIAI